MRKRKAITTGAGRAEILSAALREFAETGFRGASTSSIARRAKVTQPLVYHHFASKQALWDEVVKGVFGELLLELKKVGEQRFSNRRERIEKLLRTFVAFNGKHPELSRLIRAESAAGGAPFDELYSRWLSPLIQLFEAELGAGISEGTLRPVDPRFAYFLIVGAVTHPFGEKQTAHHAFALNFSDDATVEAYADFVVEALLCGLEKRSGRGQAKTSAT